MGFVLRPGILPDDAAAIARMIQGVWRTPVSPEQVMVDDSERDPAKPSLRLVAEVDGQVVGIGRAMAWGDPKEAIIMRVYVDPAFRRRGIGGALYREVEAYVTSFQPAKTPSSTYSDEEDGRGFLERRGFEYVHTMYAQEAELSEALPEVSLASGYEVTSYADLKWDNKDERIFGCVDEADQDTPHIDNFGRMSFNDFKRAIVGSKTFIPEACALALKGDEVVGFSNVMWNDVTDRSLVMTDFTGVRRAHRGKGLAKSLKNFSLLAVKAMGVSRCRTFNAAENAPMLAINRAVGFAVKHEMLDYLKKRGR